MRITVLVLCLASACAVGSAGVAQAAKSQSDRAFAASNGRPYCLKGQRLKGSKKRGYECWFRRQGEWWAEGVECRAHYQRVNVYRHRRYTGERCAPEPKIPVSTPLAVYGAISSVRAIGGNVVGATYTVRSSGCSATSCVTYAHAFQIPASQACDYGNGVHSWVFKGGTHYVPYNEAATATFTRRYSGSTRICLFVETIINGNRNQVFVNEAIVDAAGTSHSLVPLTVTNICSFNPGLGERHAFHGPAGPGVYWDNDKNGIVDFAAFSYEGDNAVDAVFVNDAKGVLTWVAHCYPTETHWVNVGQYLADHSMPPPQPQQPQPPQQLQSSTTPLPGASGPTVVDMLNAGTVDEPWTIPNPSVGSIEVLVSAV